MTRDEALLHRHAQTLNGFLNEIDHLIDHPAKYVDPDFSNEPSTGKTLYERARVEATQILRDFRHLSASSVPAMAYRFPTGIGESLNRDDLRRLRGDVEVLIQLVAARRN